MFHIFGEQAVYHIRKTCYRKYQHYIKLYVEDSCKKTLVPHHLHIDIGFYQSYYRVIVFKFSVCIEYRTAVIYSNGIFKILPAEIKQSFPYRNIFHIVIVHTLRNISQRYTEQYQIFDGKPYCQRYAYTQKCKELSKIYFPAF